MSYSSNEPTGVSGRYFVTFNVMVFEMGFPFLGVTVTMTLHEPALRPLRVDPNTLQYFAELAKTFSETLDVESTASPENVAIDLTGIALDIFTLIGGTVDVFAAGVETVGVDVDVVFQPGVVCFTDVLDPSPLPFHDEITKS